MYSFYYVATGLKNADFVFFIWFCGGKGLARQVASCCPGIVLSVANSVGTEPYVVSGAFVILSRSCLFSLFVCGVFFPIDYDLTLFLTKKPGSFLGM